MKNSHKFFSNNKCKYFPCHKIISDSNSDDSDDFNCLFCYCPLYYLGGKCGGQFKYGKTGVKNCADCCLPHMPEYYDVIITKIKEIRELKEAGIKGGGL